MSSSCPKRTLLLTATAATPATLFAYMAPIDKDKQKGNVKDEKPEVGTAAGCADYLNAMDATAVKLTGPEIDRWAKMKKISTKKEKKEELTEKEKLLE